MERIAAINRSTKETEILLELNLEGGAVEVETGIGFFDHMLTVLGFYAGMGLKLRVKGDLHVDGHHTAEDTGIALGQALKAALGDKAGVCRFGSAFVPMDEALAMTVLDLSGRPYLVFDAVMPQERIGEYESCLTKEFMAALASCAGLTLHQKILSGDNAHHITEALFKSLGLALKQAVKIEGGAIPSTKGVL
jgi:imidazoleglycerol-phosphate dehydratase